MKSKLTLTPRDKYLRKKFEISEKEFETAFNLQGRVCKACGRPPTTKNLHTDHDHDIENWKIAYKKIHNGLWWAWPKDGTGRLDFHCDARTMPKARAAVKLKLKRLSVRGILCWSCNAGLKKYEDDPVRLHKIAEYLDEYYAFVNKDIDTRNGFGE